MVNKQVEIEETLEIMEQQKVNEGNKNHKESHEEYIDAEVIQSHEDYEEEKYRRTRKRALDKKYKAEARIKNKLGKNATNQLKAYRIKNKVIDGKLVEYTVKKGKNSLTGADIRKAVTNKKVRNLDKSIADGKAYKKVN